MVSSHLYEDSLQFQTERSRLPLQNRRSQTEMGVIEIPLFNSNTGESPHEDQILCAWIKDCLIWGRSVLSPRCIEFQEHRGPSIAFEGTSYLPTRRPQTVLPIPDIRFASLTTFVAGTFSLEDTKL
jgi:hypothetical protein